MRIGWIGLSAALAVCSPASAEIRAVDGTATAYVDASYRPETGKAGLRYVPLNKEIIFYIDREVREAAQRCAEFDRTHPAEVRCRTSTSAFLYFADNEMVDGRAPAVEIVIDGQEVTIGNRRPVANYDYFPPPNSFHRQNLELGVHSVVVRDPARNGRVLYDGEVLMNGLADVTIAFDRCHKQTSACKVKVLRYRDEVIFEYDLASGHTELSK